MMKTSEILKHLGMLVLVLGVAVGCASGPKNEDESPDAEQVASEAIGSAQSAIDEAAALGAEWRDSQKVLDDAKAAFEQGDFATATDLASQAERQARNAIAQLNSGGEGSVAGSGGRFGGASTYEVSSGDNLWSISGNSSTYGDPYQWPLIYKANKSKIKDADLIYPGQVFDIDSSPSGADVSAAISHAKSRGAWSVGAVEASDEAYLAQ